MNGICENPTCPHTSLDIRFVPLDDSYLACMCKDCYDEHKDEQPESFPQKDFEAMECVDADFLTLC